MILAHGPRMAIRLPSLQQSLTIKHNPACRRTAAPPPLCWRRCWDGDGPLREPGRVRKASAIVPKIFHAKHFGTIAEAEYSRPRTSGRLRCVGLRRTSQLRRLDGAMDLGVVGPAAAFDPKRPYLPLVAQKERPPSRRSSKFRTGPIVAAFGATGLMLPLVRK